MNAHIKLNAGQTWDQQKLERRGNDRELPGGEKRETLEEATLLDKRPLLEAEDWQKEKLGQRGSKD